MAIEDFIVLCNRSEEDEWVSMDYSEETIIKCRGTNIIEIFSVFDSVRTVSYANQRK